jgi:amino acid permease
MFKFLDELKFNCFIYVQFMASLIVILMFYENITFSKILLYSFLNIFLAMSIFIVFYIHDKLSDY